MDRLSSEIRQNAFKSLTPAEQLAASRVSRLWHQELHDKTIWRDHFTLSFAPGMAIEVAPELLNNLRQANPQLNIFIYSGDAQRQELLTKAFNANGGAHYEAYLYQQHLTQDGVSIGLWSSTNFSASRKYGILDLQKFDVILIFPNSDEDLTKATSFSDTYRSQQVQTQVVCMTLENISSTTESMHRIKLNPTSWDEEKNQLAIIRKIYQELINIHFTSLARISLRVKSAFTREVTAYLAHDNFPSFSEKKHYEKWLPTLEKRFTWPVYFFKQAAQLIVGNTEESYSLSIFRGFK